MSSPRFYFPIPISTDGTTPAASGLALPDELAHHAIRVLRLKAGTQIILFDGLGGQYLARLRIDGKAGFADIIEHQEVDAELPGRLTLIQGIASGDKMDWIIEKSVELGAARLVPVAARRSVPQLKGERLDKRRRHWQRIARAASEQCGRNRLMQIAPPCSLADWLDRYGKRQMPERPGQLLCCHPGAAVTLGRALRPDTDDIGLLVGPEGGWSDEELALAAAHGAARIRFGARVLRTETAGPALLAAVSALKGWQ